MKIIIPLLASLGLAPGALCQQIAFTTESYPPYSYSEANGNYRGVAVDQVALLMRDAGYPYTIEILPWARAIAMAETQSMCCVFTTAHTPERATRFKWVLPLVVDRNLLVTRSNSGIRAATIEEAKRLRVGTQRGDYTEDLLHSLAFPNIDLSADIETTLRKLIEGRVDLMPLSEGSYEKLRGQGVTIEPVMVFSVQHLGIACNGSVPDEMIARMQQSLDKLIADGMQAAILRHYGVAPAQ